jgi:hypothetical protein
MIKVFVTISVEGPKNTVDVRDETLIIDKLSPPPNGIALPTPGLWTSHTKWLGRTLSGKYYLRNYHLEKFGPSRGNSLADPVGWFLDSPNLDDPFMILSNFDEGKGIGVLLRTDPDLPPLAKQSVHWEMWR